MRLLNLTLFLPCVFRQFAVPIYAHHCHHYSFTLTLLCLHLHSLTHHGLSQLCEGALCQLVSPTCRCGSLEQASAGCEIGHLTFVHELFKPPPPAPCWPKHTTTHPQEQKCCYDLKLTFMVCPPSVVGVRRQESDTNTNNTSSLGFK